MCAAYFMLLALYPLLFSQKRTALSFRSLLSLGTIILISTLVLLVSFSIQDVDLGNRVLHTFGGGFLGFLVCFLAAKDSRININRFQFLVFSALIVLALGIANELLEFMLQEYVGMIFAIHVNDTWLDLASNVTGIVLGALLITPFYRGN